MFERNTTILVVDDSVIMRKIVVNICNQIGFMKIHEAVDGHEAWEILSSSGDEIGLVISDWSMPVCTGIDLLNRIRIDDRFKDMAFVLVTSESKVEKIREAIEAGVDCYITKPFTSDHFRRELEEMHERLVRAERIARSDAPKYSKK